MINQYLNSCRFVIFLSIAALGPYVFPAAGLRLEHFVIYGSLIYVMISEISLFKYVKKIDNLLILMVLCLAVALWILTVSLPNIIGGSSAYKILSAMENFTQPIALIVVISSVVGKLDRTSRLNLLRIASISIIVLLCINSFLAISEVFFDTWPFLQYFVVAGNDGLSIVSVSELALTMGRFSGVFNQPAESGLAYSIGLLVWVYLATTSKRISSLGWASLIMLTIGGSLSVSKSFILGGFPLAMLYWFWIALSRLRIRISTLIGGLIWGLGGGVALSFIIELWEGFNFFSRLFVLDNINEGIVELFTGGRFGGDESGVILHFAEVWSKAPLTGVGVGLINEQALDNALIEYFLYGGIIGLAFYIAIILVIFWVAFRGLKSDPVHGKLLMSLWILINGAGIGAPVLTLNRSSIFLWIILIVTFGVISKKKSLLLSKVNISQFQMASNRQSVSTFA